MKYYTIAELDVTDPAWVREYVRNVTGMVERFGGRYLARTSRIERLEGRRANPQLFLLIEWPSRESAMSFYESEEYRPYLDRRQAGSEGEFVLIAGEDINRRARLD